MNWPAIPFMRLESEDLLNLNRRHAFHLPSKHLSLQSNKNYLHVSEGRSLRFLVFTCHVQHAEMLYASYSLVRIDASDQTVLELC